MKNVITITTIGVALCVLAASPAASAATLEWPLPFSVTVWLAGAGILAVVGFIGRKK